MGHSWNKQNKIANEKIELVKNNNWKKKRISPYYKHLLFPRTGVNSHCEFGNPIFHRTKLMNSQHPCWTQKLLHLWPQIKRLGLLDLECLLGVEDWTTSPSSMSTSSASVVVTTSRCIFILLIIYEVEFFSDWYNCDSTLFGCLNFLLNVEQCGGPTSTPLSALVRTHFNIKYVQFYRECVVLKWDIHETNKIKLQTKKLS